MQQKWMQLALALVVTISFATALHAQGGPPMITDDPGTPGPGRWEINIAIARTSGCNPCAGRAGRRAPPACPRQV